MNPILEALSEYPAARLEARRRELRASGATIFDFGLGDPVEEVPDFLRQALIAGVPRQSGYPSESIRAQVAEAVAGYLQRRFGVAVDPESEVLVTGGSKAATYQLPLLVGGQNGQGLLYPDPGYPSYARGGLLAGLELHPVRLGPDGAMRIWELPDRTLERVALAWINSPSNPTGAVLCADELERTIATCRAHDILLVSDECYADMHAGEAPQSILEFGREGVLAVHSLSKRSGLTGYRSGFLAGDAEWIRKLATLRATMSSQPQDFVNAAAVAAWSDDAHVDARRERLMARRGVLAEALLGLGLEVADTVASFYLWVRAPGGLSGEAFADHLAARGVLVAPGAWFASTTAGDAYIRVAVSEQDIEGATVAWRRAMEEL